MSSIFEVLWPATAAGQLFNGLIYFLFILACFRVQRCRAAIARDQKSLDQVRNTLMSGALETPSETTQIADLATLRKKAGLLETIDPKQPKTLIEKRIALLWALRNQGRSAVEAVNALDDVNEAFAHDVPRYVASILVLLGLAGTVWGLHDVIGHINDNLRNTSADADTMHRQLVGAFTSMRSAFSCTMAGILCSVILAYILTRGDTAERQLASDLDQTIALEIAPLIVPMSETTQLEKMSEIIQESQAATRQFAETIKDSRDFFAETLGEAVRGAASALASSLSAATEDLNKSLNDMRGAASVLAESAENVQRYRMELEAERQQVLNYLRESADRLGRLGESVLTPLGNASDSLVACRKDILELTERNEVQSAQLSEQLIAVVSEIMSASGAIGDVGAAVQGVATTFTRSAEEMEKRQQTVVLEHAAMSEQVREKLSGLLDRLRPELIELPNGQLIGDTFAGLTLRFDQIGTQITQSNATTASSIDEQRKLNALLQKLADSDRSGDLVKIGQEEKQLLARAVAAIDANSKEIHAIRLSTQTPLWKQVFRGTNGTDA